MLKSGGLWKRSTAGKSFGSYHIHWNLHLLSGIGHHCHHIAHFQVSKDCLHSTDECSSLCRKLRLRDTSKYHIQLCIAIFCMLLAFVSGAENAAEVYGACVFVSVLIHYFSLAAVLWMGAEAVLMFHKLVLVFKRVTKKTIIITSVLCWSEFCCIVVE